MCLPLSPRPLQRPSNELKTPRKLPRSALDSHMTSLYSSGPPDCHSSEPQTPTWAHWSVPDHQGDPWTSPDHKTPGHLHRTPRSLQPLSRNTLDPHPAQGSSLEWGLPTVIPS